MKTSADYEQEHVILNEGNVQSMTAVVDAKMFHILSANIYQDPITAMVREILCNADDAHIQNKVDHPIEISLSSSELVIKDYGSGIDPDEFLKIYGTYGYSTKESDSSQTGGFGLGSKSPFAYSDIFTVINHFGGQAYTYLLSKRNLSVDGHPSVSLFGSKPSDHTGLEVRVPINNRDEAALSSALQTFLKYSGINALLNGFPVEDQLPHPLKTNEKFFYEKKLLRPHIRYGTVLYPINYNGPCKFIAGGIYQAPPDSLSLNPGRDSLFYDDKTNQTIRELSDKAPNYHERYFKQKAKELRNTLTDSEYIYSKDILPRPYHLKLYKFKYSYNPNKFYQKLLKKVKYFHCHHHWPKHFCVILTPKYFDNQKFKNDAWRMQIQNLIWFPKSLVDENTISWMKKIGLRVIDDEELFQQYISKPERRVTAKKSSKIIHDYQLKKDLSVIPKYFIDEYAPNLETFEEAGLKLEEIVNLWSAQYKEIGKFKSKYSLQDASLIKNQYFYKKAKKLPKRTRVIHTLLDKYAAYRRLCNYLNLDTSKYLLDPIHNYVEADKSINLNYLNYIFNNLDFELQLKSIPEIDAATEIIAKEFRRILEKKFKISFPEPLKEDHD